MAAVDSLPEARYFSRSAGTIQHLLAGQSGQDFAVASSVGQDQLATPWHQQSASLDLRGTGAIATKMYVHG